MKLWDWLDEKLNPAPKRFKDGGMVVDGEIDPVPLVVDQMNRDAVLRQARAYEIACGRVPVGKITSTTVHDGGIEVVVDVVQDLDGIRRQIARACGVPEEIVNVEPVDQYDEAERRMRTYIETQFPRMKVDPSRRIFGVSPLDSAVRAQEGVAAYRDRLYREWLNKQTDATRVVTPDPHKLAGQDDGCRGGPALPSSMWDAVSRNVPKALQVIDQHTEFQWFDGETWEDTTAEGAAQDDGYPVRHRTVTTMAGAWVDGLS